MDAYTDSQQLNNHLHLLFNKIIAQENGAIQSLSASRIVIKIQCTQPAAEITIDGRRHPVHIEFGRSTTRPDLNVTLPAEMLHWILLKQIPLRKALGSGQLKVQGPILRMVVLEEIFHLGQSVYPEVLNELSARTY
jgi:hypothetical protein